MSEETKYKIVQILPVNNVWLRYKEDDEKYFYDKAIGLALIEFHVEHIGLCQGLTYLCRADVEYLELGGAQLTQDILFDWELPAEFKDEMDSIHKGSGGIPWHRPA